MALALDGSTPTAVTANGSIGAGATSTLTTSSFTPPSGSLLVVVFGTNEGAGGATSSFAVTDNLGSHLSYTHLTQQGNNTQDVQVNVWWAAVSTSSAMTVSASYANSIAQTSPSLLRVLVITGAETGSPIGATGGGRGRTTNISGTAAQYNSTRDNSWGWLSYADWTQHGTPTVSASETVDSSYDVAGEDSYAVVKNNSTTTPSGAQVTLSTSTPTASLQLSWIYFEVLPAAAVVARPRLALLGVGT